MGLSEYWATKYDGRPVAHTGTAFADGGGNSVGKRAELLAALDMTWSSWRTLTLRFRRESPN